jgi:hypothetical protein
MQKQECREFIATKPDWELYRKLSEFGVSGYKVPAKKRDAIQEIKQEALDGKFDVLLVYMFDRLGRIDDEAPFIVEWFVKHGIEVWSTREGEQKFEHHVDKLTNYIRFWQAAGESEKTSIRKDGNVTVTPRTRYVCYNKTRHKHRCDGQTGYTVSKLDKIIDEVIHNLFSQLNDLPKEAIIEERYSERIAENQIGLTQAKAALMAHRAEVA